MSIIEACRESIIRMCYYPGYKTLRLCYRLVYSDECRFTTMLEF